MLLQLDGQGPRYAQITRAIGVLIRTAVLEPGARLPATRDLARDLGCSRNIVLLAYEQLTMEGYLEARTGAGTFVSREIATAGGASSSARPVATPQPDRLSSSGRRAVNAAMTARDSMRRRRDCSIDFMYGLCRPDARIAARLRGAFAAAVRNGAFTYADPSGDASLRSEVAQRLHGVRGIARGQDQVVITSGAQQALELVTRLLVASGDHVVLEDPGYAAARAQFEAAGAVITRVPVDQHGLVVDRLPRSGAPVRLVYITPSHQFPTGVVMSAGRRYALLAWARQYGAVIMEDDYDGEFRYAGRPVPAVAALDPDGPVIYCGTFAKSLFPALRLGYLSLPQELQGPATSAKWLLDMGSSMLLQQVVAELMRTGEYDRHIRRLLPRYGARREMLVEAVTRELGTEAVVEGSAAGLHVMVWFPRLPARLEPALVDACAARDVGVHPVTPCASAELPCAGLVLGYGLVDPGSIVTGVERIAEAYRAVTAPAGGAAPIEKMERIGAADGSRRRRRVETRGDKPR